LKERVALGFSGGVDSFFAAFLLKEAGYDVKLFYFHLLEKEPPQRLYKSAELLKLPLQIVDLRSEFRKQVVDYFISSYKKGLTPNPCAVCNRDIKLKYLYLLKKDRDFDYIATGHYARVLFSSPFNTHLIAKGKDRKKEQSYFLALVEREILSHLLLPLGEWKKEEVVRRARELGYEYEGESQDICFIEGGDYTSFLKEHLKAKPGEFRLKGSGEVLGTHKGLFHYTVGQRRGLGIPYKYPLYVYRLSPKDNVVWLSKKEELLKDRVFISSPNWFVEPERLTSFPLSAKVRYRSKEIPVRELKYFKSGIYCVKLAAKAEAPSPGQICALYAGDFLVGGGEITSEG